MYSNSLSGDAVRLVRSLSPNTKIIGNGDINSLKRGRELADEFKLDGLMIGMFAHTERERERGRKSEIGNKIDVLITNSLLFRESCYWQSHVLPSHFEVS
jgi:tRNA-dihydrouridine synthase